MHLSHIPQCTIQNRNVHISVLNGALWDMGQVHCGICESGQLELHLFGTNSLINSMGTLYSPLKNTSHGSVSMTAYIQITSRLRTPYTEYYMCHLGNRAYHNKALPLCMPWHCTRCQQYGRHLKASNKWPTISASSEHKALQWLFSQEYKNSREETLLTEFLNYSNHSKQGLFMIKQLPSLDG